MRRLDLSKALASIHELHPIRNASPEQIEEEKSRRALSLKVARDKARAGMEPWLRKVGVGHEHVTLSYNESLIPARLREWARTFPTGMLCRGGALICGNNGGGKTAAAAWLIRRAYMSGRFRFDGVEFQYTHPSARLVKAHDIYRAAEQNWFGWTADLIKPQLLVIDNVGTAYEGFGKGAATMEWIADKRWEAHRPTVVTTTLWCEAGKPNEDTFQRRYPSLYDRTMDRAGVGLVKIERASLRNNGGSR